MFSSLSGTLLVFLKGGGMELLTPLDTPPSIGDQSLSSHLLNGQCISTKHLALDYVLTKTGLLLAEQYNNIL